jgi:transmembrane sensor
MIAALAIGWTLRPGDIAPAAFLPQTVAATAVNTPQREQTFRTSVGQRTTVTMPEGSIITLDTDSLLRTRDSGDERRVELYRGRAYFKVAKDKQRPFVVMVGGKSVVATGTEFAVDVAPSSMVVTLVEGGVRVEAPRKILPGKATVELKPGQQLVAALDTDNHWRTARVDTEKEVSWTSGRLHFFNDTLGKAAGEMNRYSEKKIVIRDTLTAAQPIVGNFRAGDVDAFVRAITLHGFARVKVETDDVVELVPVRGKPDARAHPSS